MQFLRTLFWVVLAVVAVIFGTRNWVTVPVTLWGGFVADVKLPVLLLGAFLAGLIPPFVLYRTTRWRYRRRLGQVERSLAETRPLLVPEAASAIDPAAVVPALAPMPPTPLP